MGTRNLTAVFYKGEYRIAQYGQWDGYPEGQGKTVLEFVRDRMDRDKFLAKLLALRELTAAKSEEIDRNNKDDWQRLYPQLSRDAGAEILDLVQAGPDGMWIKRYLAFAADSLFCEWAYVLDFDKNTFEAYRGFNLKPVDPSQRFADIPFAEDRNADYYHVKFITSWRLDTLPTTEKFLKELDPPDEDEKAA